LALLLLLLLIGVPLLEIAIFIQVGGLLGLWPTLGLVILTAVLGTVLLRGQGLAVMARAQAQLDRNEMPVQEVFDGVFLLAAGLLLLTPGFFTDAIGFAFLVPKVRRYFGRKIFESMMKHGRVHVFRTGSGRPGTSGTSGGGPAGSKGRSGTIIEGEFEDLGDAPPHGGPDETTGPGHDDSPWRKP